LIIATRDSTTLRQAREEDLPRIMEITCICYEPVYDSFISIIGEELYEEVIRKPAGLTWKQRKEKKIRGLFEKHSEWVWVLDDGNEVIGYVTFGLTPDKNLGDIDNNGVHPNHAGKGWATFMYRHVLQYFRDEGIRFAVVETELDDAHIPARRAYEAVGFDRPQKIVNYWQDLDEQNQGSTPE
jgi:ribosomal protein S18 acetylase RimI-like enzyme